jgi:hypothetical protein
VPSGKKMVPRKKTLVSTTVAKYPRGIRSLFCYHYIVGKIYTTAPHSGQFRAAHQDTCQLHRRLYRESGRHRSTPPPPSFDLISSHSVSATKLSLFLSDTGRAPHRRAAVPPTGEPADHRIGGPHRQRTRRRGGGRLCHTAADERKGVSR